MENKTEDLIKNLTQSHVPKPWWKNYRTLLGLWFCLNVIVFILETLRVTSGSQASTGFLIINVLASGISWFVFTQNLNHSFDQKWNWISFSILVLLAVFGFFYSDLSGTVLHQRPAEFTSADGSCFNHIVLLSIPAALLYPFFIKNFFIQRPGWLISFIIAQVSLLSISVVERQCPNREFWHLILGHQSSYVGITLIFMVSYTLLKKKAVLAP